MKEPISNGFFSSCMYRKLPVINVLMYEEKEDTLAGYFMLTKHVQVFKYDSLSQADFRFLSYMQRSFIDIF
jgi:hypothetical protein